MLPIAMVLATSSIFFMAIILLLRAAILTEAINGSLILKIASGPRASLGEIVLTGNIIIFFQIVIAATIFNYYDTLSADGGVSQYAAIWFVIALLIKGLTLDLPNYIGLKFSSIEIGNLSTPFSLYLYAVNVYCSLIVVDLVFITLGRGVKLLSGMRFARALAEKLGKNEYEATRSQR